METAEEGLRINRSGLFLGAVLVFLALCLMVNAGLFRSFDHGVSRELKRITPLALTWFFGLVCRTGNAEFTVPLGIIFAILAIRSGRCSRDAGIFWIFWFVFGMVLEHILKTHLFQPHPGSDVENDPLDRYLKAILYVATPGSFPSGHTFRAFWLVVGSRLAYPTVEKKVLVWATVVMVGVVVIGWHWTTDTWGSLAWVAVGAGWLRYRKDTVLAG
ncbi:MAG: phosphatase PAP2 family protein [Leptospirales bacterium]